jgi:hypothetical protein
MFAVKRSLQLDQGEHHGNCEKGRSGQKSGGTCQKGSR